MAERDGQYRAHGHAEVRDYWTRQWAQVDPHVEPVAIHDGENGATIVEVHRVVRDLSGKVLLDAPIQHVFRIENRLITRMDIRPSGKDLDDDHLG